jgi:hypothetical protein
MLVLNLMAGSACLLKGEAQEVEEDVEVEVRRGAELVGGHFS